MKNWSENIRRKTAKTQRGGMKSEQNTDTGIRFYRESVGKIKKGYGAQILLFLCYLCGAEGVLYALDFVLFLDFRLKEAAAATAAVCLICGFLACREERGDFFPGLWRRPAFFGCGGVCQRRPARRAFFMKRRRETSGIWRRKI